WLFGYAAIAITRDRSPYRFVAARGVGVHRPGGGAPWVAVVGQKTDSIRAPIRDHAWQSLLRGLPLMGAMALFALLLGRIMARPVIAMKRYAIAVGEGNTPPPLGMTGRDELGALGRALDQMVEKLRALTVSRDDLAKSEKRYRSLFENMQGGFAYHEIILDDQGVPVDYRFLSVNRAFEKITGLKAENVIGKRVTEAIPLIEKDPADWIGTYGRVALTGKPVAFTQQTPLLQKWFHVNAYSPEPGHFATVFNDITEQMAASRELKREKERAQAYLDTAGVMLVVLDRQGTLTLINRAGRILLGVEEEQALGKNWFDTFIPPVALEEIKQLFTRLMEGEIGPVEYHENPVVTADGAVRLVAFHNALLYDDAGKIEGVLFSGEDITDQRRTEEGLRESEEKYRRLVENAPDILYRYSFKRGGLYYSNVTASVLGYAPEELLASPFLWGESVHPDDRAMVELAVSSFAEGKPFDIEYRFRHKDGSWRRLRDRCISIAAAGNDIVVEGLATDITRRWEGETTLRRLQTAIEQASESIVITDRDGTIEYVNPFFEKITGYTAAEAVGQNPRILKSDRQDEAFYERLWHTITSGHVWNGRVTNRKKSGEEYQEESTITPLTDAAGSITGYVAVKRDITNEQLLEREVRQVQKLNAIGTLAGGIAHDFNNILMPILGYASLLREQKPEGETAEFIDEILLAARRAKELVAQILAFSRRSEQRSIPVRVPLVAKEVAKLLKATTPTSVAIDTDIDAALDPVLGDPTRLHQVILNLCTNALYAMRETGGTLSLTLARAGEWEITPLGLTPGERGHLRLSVADTGVGMDEATLERATEPFFTTKPEGEGTGMGLSVTHGIVESFGGRMTIVSAPGEGTTVTVYLPMVASGEEAVAVSFPPPGDGEMIFVVDDEGGITQMLAASLTLWGYQVLTDTHADQALRRFLADPRRIDLVLTDVSMPGMSGVQLTRELLAARPDLPVLLMSGSADRLTPTEVAALGAAALLPKPVEMATLASAIREALDRRGRS
ncbi:MAG: PAS domain S-box protein, partial [Nitrospinae bacterium]|nr:PAS domain S-box protein [Nitrospinota bacterium]